MYEPLSAIYPDLRRAGTMFYERPDPSGVTRPYGFLALVGEPPSPLAGETECSFTVSYFGTLTEVNAFADAIAWVHGHKIPMFRTAHGLRYTRESRVITPDSEIRGVWQMVDTLTCRYLHAGRLEAVM